MAEFQNGSASSLREQLEAVTLKLEAVLQFTSFVQEELVSARERVSTVKQLIEENGISFRKIMDHLGSAIEQIFSDQAKLRAVLLGKMDGLQGTVDLVREDVRNA